ncbi:hypothetical protein [Mucilaginibacter paludis]|nr:hypothetical protein [Mucilaginibacter paludis]
MAHITVMIYFKKVLLTQPDKDQVAKAIRKVSLKRNNPLDFTSSRMLAGTDKRFFGSEGKKSTNFTRIRYSIEDLLPKLIINFSKDPNHQFYKVRLSFISSVAFCFLSVMLLAVLALLYKNHDGIEVLAYMALFYSIFILLILLEIRLTDKAIQSVVNTSLQASTSI